MKLRDLHAACKGQSDQKIKDLIRGTDEYQAVLTDGSGSPRLMRDMFNTGLLLVRVCRKVFCAGHVGLVRPRMARSRAVSCLIRRMVAAILV